MESKITTRRIIEGDYNYDVFCDEGGNEIGRSCAGMTERAQLFFYLDVIAGMNADEIKELYGYFQDLRNNDCIGREKRKSDAG
jgi:hypothetical protein